jgi:hypothetical protein
MNEKSILEQALLQVKTLEEAVKTNAKGILASTMKQELNDLLKESLEEEDDVYEQAPKKGKKDVPDEGDEDLDNEEMDDEELDMDDEDSEMDDEDSEMDDEELDMDNEDSEMDDEELDMDDEDSDFDSLNMGNDQPDMGGFDSEDNEVFNATDASPSEVLRIFKAMKPEDGFIVKKDDGQIEFKDGDNEYIIKLDESEMDEYPMDEEDEFFGDEYSSMDEEDEFFSDEDDDSLFGPQSMSVDEENDFDDAIKSHMNNDDEVVYEIDLDGNDDDMMSPEGDVGEAARTKWNIHGDKGGSNRAGIKSKKLFASGAINEEVTKLKKQNTEYRKALILFKDKLNEVAVFNANLAYATRLFTEHSTTKKEKINILKKFDSVSTLKESKNLYNNLKNDLDTKKPVSESVVEKLRTSPSTSSSTQVLSEAKAYENPQFRRMKDLMSKLK